MSQTFILYIGSPWRADKDNVETLFDALSKFTLDPDFEQYGNFTWLAETDMVATYNQERKLVPPLIPARTRHYWGNFYDVSCVFSLYTDDAALIARLDAAIAANKDTDAYRVAKLVREEQAAVRRVREARRALRTPRTYSSGGR